MAATGDKVKPAAGANQYGTRNPHTCANSKAPSGASIDNARARESFICHEEKATGNLLYLVENVKVETMGSTRYDPRTQTGFSQMDTRINPIAIRGSFLEYQCSVVDAKFDSRGQRVGVQYE